MNHSDRLIDRAAGERMSAVQIVADVIKKHRFSRVSKRHPWAISDGTGDCGTGFGWPPPPGNCNWRGTYQDHATHVAEAILDALGNDRAAVLLDEAPEQIARRDTP